MTTIYLIRHAEAEGNIFRRLHGQYDSLLTPRGHKQVECLQKRFENIHIDGCFASDLTRTSLTARAIYIPKGLPLHRDPRFREVHVGVWEDIPYGYLDNFEEAGMHDFTHNPPQWYVEGAERFEEYTQRFLDGMTDAAEAYDGGTIAIFGHGAAIRSTLMRLFFMDDLSKLRYSDNTGVCKLFYDNGVFTYEYLNDNSHIPEELSTFFIQRWWRETGRRKESAVHFRLQEQTREQRVMTVLLREQPIGTLTLGAPVGKTGQILGMTLQAGYEGRYYGDQLLGEAFSYYRKLGCTELAMAPGVDVDGVFGRYAFDPATRSRSIDTKVFDWSGK